MIKPSYVLYSTPTLNEFERFISEIINKIMYHNVIYGNFLLDCKASGLRFQELYNISFCYAEDKKFYYFHTQKGSNDRTLLKANFSTYFYNLKLNSVPFYFEYSLSNFYTVFNRFAFPYKIFHGQKELSAHSLRHLYAKTLYELTGDRVTVQNDLGEVDIKNSDNYIDSDINIKRIYY
jgi:integrase